MKNLKLLFTTLVLIICGTLDAEPKKTYFFSSLNKLEITNGSLPSEARIPRSVRSMNWQRARILGDCLFPYAIGDNGETFYVALEGRARFNANSAVSNALANLRIATAVPQGGIPSGTLYVPRMDWSGMDALKFRIPTAPLKQQTARANYLKAKVAHYERLRNLGATGSAWYRHQSQKAGLELKNIDEETRGNTNLNNGVSFRNRRDSSLNATYDLFSGGRAVSENLQLDRQLRIPEGEDDSGKRPRDIDIDGIQGITIAEINWKERIDPEKAVRADTLAKAVPHDQHVLLFPSFQAMIDLIDQSRDQGTPIQRLLEERPEDAFTQERYEKQMCLPTDKLARLLGSSLIKSVALTGSDPFLRTGSDVAVLFESIDANTLVAAIQLRQRQAALSAKPAAKAVSGTIQGTGYTGVTNTNRGLCSYLASKGGIVIVTNSLFQLDRVLSTIQGHHTSIAGLDEYTWFRQRYEKGNPDETAFFLLTDATIRRWCGARWRIGASRRVQAAAALSELQARRMANDPGSDSAPRWLGMVDTVAGAPQSDIYGNLSFLTPISELALDQVTKEEAQAYAGFRERYQSRWRNFFDPVGGTIHTSGNKLSMDITVLPLIEGSEYNEMLAFTGEQQFSVDAADPGSKSLLHFILAIDMKTRQMRQLGTFAARTAPRVGANGLGWIGKWVSVQLEDGPFWKDLANHSRKGEGDAEDFVEDNFHRIPVLTRVDVRNPFKMTAFLAAFRAFLDQTSPGMLAWENHTHLEQTYVRVGLTEKTRRAMKKDTFRNFALYYHVAPTRLTLSLREDLIKKTLDPQPQPAGSAKDDESGDGIQNPPKWQGKSVGLRLTDGALPHMRNLFQDNMTSAQQWRSWNNLHILNEWRRNLGVADALGYHEQHWHTRLTCPGGGQYQWNEEFRTYESTVFGHPARPKNPDILMTSPLANLQEIGLGITFEEDGLRARTEILRKPQPD